MNMQPMIDSRVEDIREVTGMWPRDAIVTVHHERREFDGFGADGNTPNWYYYEEVEEVPAKVWPVAMGAEELLVEWLDGCFGAVKLRDIRLGVVES